jgi:hypothetical protein
MQGPRVYIVNFVYALLELELETSDQSGIEPHRIWKEIANRAAQHGLRTPSPAEVHPVTSDVVRIGLAKVTASKRYISTPEAVNMFLRMAGVERFGHFLLAARKFRCFDNIFKELDAGIDSK